MNTKSHDGRNDDVKKLLVVLLELHGRFLWTHKLNGMRSKK